MNIRDMSKEEWLEHISNVQNNTIRNNARLTFPQKVANTVFGTIEVKGAKLIRSFKNSNFVDVIVYELNGKEYTCTNKQASIMAELF